ncbi:MAG: DUF4965 domain-containing protein [Planctomycetes bacterium]|nr:DUF4965 domain-containing protein [Planctomycetota bacterium]
MRWPRTSHRAVLVVAALSVALGLPRVSAAGASGPRRTLRAPAVPLVAHDPYFSIWSAADRLTDAETTHWTGKPHPLHSMVRIDGEAFRLMGAEPKDVPALPQASVEVLPTRTIYRFAGSKVRLTLTFLTPALPSDLDVLSRPLTYLVWDVSPADGTSHAIDVYFDAGAEIAVNAPEQVVEWDRSPVDGLTVLRAGSRDQPILAKRGDDLRIDWGHLYAAAPASREVQAVIGEGARIRDAFVKDGSLPAKDDDPPRRVSDGSAVLAFRFDLGRVGAEAVSRYAMLAYDDLYSIKYFRGRLRPYWRRKGAEAADILLDAARERADIAERCHAFDERLMADLSAAGGGEYALLCALAYRQTWAGNKIAADANGMPLVFPKECFSNGCIGTVDVLFPQAPFFLVFSPALARGMLQPILDYASSPRWPYGYAPHDLGTYPHATGQVYGMGGRDGDRMPLEESGNMLIMVAAVAKADGDATLARKYDPLLRRWADYCVAEGLDPENQLCSADMFGHLPHAANLALKAIIAIGGYAQLCEATGRGRESRRYLAIARDYASKWQGMAADDGRTRLAYHLPGTWGMKHNLIWDRILGLGLFPDEVADAEIAWYRKVQKPFGLPVDNRTDTSLIDWALWSIAPARDDEAFRDLLAPIFRYANETPSRVPLSDWFVTTDGRRKGFQARPVVGGIFIRLLASPEMGSSWAKRAAKPDGTWAPAPISAWVEEIVPTARRGSVMWRYTFDEPAGDWFEPGFDDSAWKEGTAGFGAPGTPGAVVRTEWKSEAIWLRRTFDLAEGKGEDPVLLMHYDEDPEVYINGILAAHLKGWSTSYDEVEIAPAARAALRPGRNLLAVRARQTYGGQSIDVGLGDVSPKPPAPSDPRAEAAAIADSVPAPLYRDPVYDGAADPVLVWNPRERAWWMFYTQRRAKLDLPGVEWCHQTEIGVAESRDEGMTWTYIGMLSLSHPDAGYSFWAPDVIRDDAGTYHLFVSYVPGPAHTHRNWGGERHIFHYTSDDLWAWAFRARIPLSSNHCIDPTLFRRPDGAWRMWYKDEGRRSETLAVESRDLIEWKAVDDPGVSKLYGEGPKVFRFAGRYWLIKDPNRGLDVYRSDDLDAWTYQGKILERPGRRNDDATIGKHADVVVCGDRAFIIYFTHPDGQDFPLRDGAMPLAARRSSLQAAELEVRDGVLSCDRDARFRIRLTPPKEK